MDGVSPATQIVFLEKRVEELEAENQQLRSSLEGERKIHSRTCVDAGDFRIEADRLRAENQRMRDALIDLITGTCSILNKE